jgi:hypothetical protein
LAALTVTLGLLGGNGALLASTVLAATPAPSWSLDQDSPNVGLLSLGSHTSQTTTTYRFTLPQQVCQMLSGLCRAGNQTFEITSGLVTLGAPTTQTPDRTWSHVTPPATGCLLGIIGCGGQATPTAKPAATPASTAKPTAATSSSSAAHSTPSAPAATPTPAAGNCTLGLLGAGCPGGGLLGGIVGNTCTPAPSGGGCQATSTPAPTAAPGLCLLSCNLLSLGGGGCVATLLQTCVVGQVASPGQPSGGSPGACVGTLCLLGSSCTASLGSACLLGALLPGLPGLSPNPPSDPTAPGGSSGNGSVPGSGAVPGGGASTLTGASTGGGGANLLSSLPAAGSSPRTAPATQAPPTAGGQTPDATVGLVSGISFGHGLLLWPLFGLLDLAALAGLVVVVRRRWTATTS